MHFGDYLLLALLGLWLLAAVRSMVRRRRQGCSGCCGCCSGCAGCTHACKDKPNG